MKMSTIKDWIYPVLMALLVILLIVFIISKNSTGKISSADINTVGEQIYSYVSAEKVNKAEVNMIKRLYGIDPSEYDGAILYYPISNMDADEMLLVKLKDISQQSVINNAIDNRLSTQLNSFEGYGIEQTNMLNNSVIYVSGNYAMFFSGNNASAALSALKDLL